MRIVLMAIMLIPLTTAPTLGTIQANQPSYPLKEVEDSIKKNPSWIPKNLFPSPSGRIIVSGSHSVEYEFTLQKQNTLNSTLFISRLNSLRECPLYKSADFQRTPSYFLCHYTRAIKVNNPPLSVRQYRVSFDDYAEYKHQ